MIYSRRKLAQGFVELLDRHAQADVVRAFTQLLHTHKLTHDLDLFVSDIARELLKRHRHLAATVTTARALAPKTMNLIRETLEGVTHATSVSVTAHINKAQKGGVIIRTPIGELDASIQRQLNYLKLQR